MKNLIKIIAVFAVCLFIVFIIHAFFKPAKMALQDTNNIEESTLNTAIFQNHNKPVILDHRQPFSTDFKADETTCIPRWVHEALHLVLQDFKNRPSVKENETNFIDHALVIKSNKDLLELEIIFTNKKSISYEFDHPFLEIKRRDEKILESIFSELKTTKANCTEFFHIDHDENIQNMELVLSGVELKSLITVLHDFDILFQTAKKNSEAYEKKISERYMRTGFPEYQLLRNHFAIKIAYKLNEDPPDVIVAMSNEKPPRGFYDFSPTYRLYYPFETIFKRWWPSLR